MQSEIFTNLDWTFLFTWVNLAALGLIIALGVMSILALYKYLKKHRDR